MLRNVVAIVSGGSSGLGAATVSQIVRNGGRVVVADLPSSKDNYLKLATHACSQVPSMRQGIDTEQLFHNNDTYYPFRPNETNLQTQEEQQKDKDAVICFSPTNVTIEKDITQALDLAQDVFGQQVNVAINCAGVAISKRTISKKRRSTTSSEKEKEKERPLVIHSLQEFSDVMQVNTLGTFNLTRLAAERMVSRTQDEEGMRGCIINTSSIAAFEGQIGQVAYSASKGAIVGMTLPLARDLATFGIRVVTVAPGLFNTPLMDKLSESVRTDLAKMVPLPQKLGDPNEFGKLIVSIVSNPMLNGEVIRLDGALRMGMK